MIVDNLSARYRNACILQGHDRIGNNAAFFQPAFQPCIVPPQPMNQRVFVVPNVGYTIDWRLVHRRIDENIVSVPSYVLRQMTDELSVYRQSSACPRRRGVDNDIFH